MLAVTCLLAACGGGGSSSSSSSDSSSSGSSSGSASTSTIAAAASNVATITVQKNSSTSIANVPYVTVQVCSVGGTVCDTVSNVILDSASVGLRVLSSALPKSLGSLTQQTISSKNVNQCGAFVSGYTWGTVRIANVTISGETASNLPIQVIGDAAAGATAPSGCQSAGSYTNMSTASALGGNGILGVMGLRVDCTSCTTVANAAAYYACGASGTSCAPTTLAATLQVANPVSKFATDNNGVIIEMPSISASGASSATGAVVFGVGTQSNNALGSATTLQTDSAFNFRSTYNGTAYTSSFVDSGSNYLFFNDSSLPRCSTYTSYYCPSTTQAETATFSPTTSPTTASYTASFSVANAETLFNSGNYAFSDIAGTLGSVGGMDFGMPFFYGKNVFVKMETTVGAADGYLAFIANTN